MASSDLPEVLLLSDRIIVLREGRVAGELARSEATAEAIMQLAVGWPNRISSARDNDNSI